MQLRRRDFIKSSAAAAALWSIPGLAHTEEKKPLIGIQLYCVRGEFEDDVPGTIQKLAELGYQGVEFYGYEGTKNVHENWPAEQLRELLDKNKIQCCGIHIGVNALGKNLETTIKNNHILGNNNLIVAAADNLMESPESIKKFAGMLNDSAKIAKQHDMRVGYHCHGFDFKEFDGETGWDRLFGQVDPEIIMQLDTGNCAEGGGDPIAILKKFPGRAKTVHVKEYEGAPLAADNSKWKEIIELCKTLHKTEWYIVEQGEASGRGFDAARMSLETLKKMI